MIKAATSNVAPDVTSMKLSIPNPTSEMNPVVSADERS
jgi:hypothetical protein